MSSYRRVTQEDRVRIKDALDADLTLSEVADKLGFHKSTISREIRRNRGQRGYRPKQAQRKAASVMSGKFFHKIDIVSNAFAFASRTIFRCNLEAKTKNNGLIKPRSRSECFHDNAWERRASLTLKRFAKRRAPGIK